MTRCPECESDLDFDGYVIEVGIPHSDKLTAVEKWRQTGPDTCRCPANADGNERPGRPSRAPP